MNNKKIKQALLNLTVVSDEQLWITKTLQELENKKTWKAQDSKKALKMVKLMKKMMP